MRKDLDYQSPKWEKEQKKDSQLLRQLKGKDITLNNLQRLLEERKKSPESRRYRSLYTNLHLKYRILAGVSYLRNPTDQQCIKYTYLSGVSAVLAYLFYVSDPPEKLDKTDRQNVILDFTLGTLQIYAVNQPLPSCIHHIDNPYVQLLLGNIDNATSLLNKLDSQFNPSEPYQFWISESERAIIQAAIEKDGQTMKDLLVQRVKRYRREPVGYSVFLDIYAIAFIKLAHIWNLNCDINVIEIPSFFFDDTVCKINPSTTQVPFFEEAKKELEQYGVALEL